MPQAQWRRLNNPIGFIVWLTYWRNEEFINTEVISYIQWCKLIDLNHSFPLSDLSFIYHTALYFLSPLEFLGANSKHQDPRFSRANKVVVKSSNKLITVHTDKDLFVRLHITSNLPERCAELWTVFNPYSLTNGSLRKGVKSTLCSILEKDVHVVQQLTASTNPQVVVINGMAVLWLTESSGADTFGELLQKYLTSSVPPLF